MQRFRFSQKTSWRPDFRFLYRAALSEKNG